jgi:alanyl-tRNA synthetase
MTERLYLQDAYTFTFAACIMERILMQAGRLAVVLDRTAFFPGTGSLPADRGWLNTAQVVEIIQRPQDGEMLHVLSEEIWENDVQGKLDWPRRLDLMRQHTAGHLLGDALARLTGATCSGIIVNDQEACLDLDKSDVSSAQIEQAEAAANEAVLSNRAVRVALVSAGQAARLGLVPVSPEGYLLSGVAQVQALSIEGASATLCDALHTARTGELGLVKVTGYQDRDGKLRVQFVAGARAAAHLRYLDQTLADIAGRLDTPVAAVPEAVAQTLAELEATRSELEAVRGTIAGYEAQALAACAETHKGISLIRRVYAERNAAELRQIARLIVEQPGHVAMLGTGGAKAQLVFARSSDVRHDMTVPIRIAAQVLNTHGGGQPALAESVPVRADEARVEAALNKAVKWVQTRA